MCDLYLADAEAGRLMTRRRTAKKASTLATDRGRIERHIKPLLGSLKVAAVTREDIEAFLHDVTAGKTAGWTKTAKNRGLARVRGGRGAASRTVGLLAIPVPSDGLIPTNPSAVKPDARPPSNLTGQ